MRTLIVDDSRVLRRMLKTMLGELQFEVAEAANGREALTRLQEIGAPDLMLVDWNMPEMNGLEFVQAVRADHSFDQVPIMMVTTETDIEQIAKALQSGANEYIMKPFDKATLADKLQQLGICTASA